jgi:hypothetical protein
MNLFFNYWIRASANDDDDSDSSIWLTDYLVFAVVYVLKMIRWVIVDFFKGFMLKMSNCVYLLVLKESHIE